MSGSRSPYSPRSPASICANSAGEASSRVLITPHHTTTRSRATSADASAEATHPSFAPKSLVGSHCWWGAASQCAPQQRSLCSITVSRTARRHRSGAAQVSPSCNTLARSRAHSCKDSRGSCVTSDAAGKLSASKMSPLPVSSSSTKPAQ